jgi:transcriptional regulator with XRE-family HTH domain
MFAVTYPPYLREKARKLRADKKLTIDEIADRLAVSRTTAFYWVGDLPIPRPGGANGWPEGARAKGNRAMREKYRRLREAAYDEGVRLYPHLSEGPSFRDFVVLFITEGHKRNRNEVGIANSDPAVVLLAARWMKSLSARKLTYWLQYHADQRPAELQRYWSDLLGVEPDAIRLQRKSNSRQLASRTWRSKYGVLTIRTGDTYFRAELQAWMDCLRDEWLDSATSGRGAVW